MTIRKIVIASPQRAKQALLVPATRRDSYRIGDVWHGVGGLYDNWQDDQFVEGVQQFPKGSYEIGDVVEIYDLGDRLSATMKIDTIRMITCADISDLDLDLLGYRDRDEWIDQAGEDLRDRRAWLLVGKVEQRDPTGPGIATGILKTTNADTGATETLVVDMHDHPIQ